MKLILLILLIFTVSIIADVTLTWDHSSSQPELRSYRLKYGRESGSYSHSFDVRANKTNITVRLPENVEIFFVVTAIGTNGSESLPSNEVNTKIPTNEKWIGGRARRIVKTMNVGQ